MQFETVVTLVVLVATGLLCRLCFLYGKHVTEQEKSFEQKENETPGRKVQKLITTQMNVAGRISNALEAGISANLQWGCRLNLERQVAKGNWVTTITILDVVVYPRQIIAMITTSCSFSTGSIYVASNFGHTLNIDGPNNPKLTLFIGEQLDFIRDWSPTPTTPKTAA